MSIQAKAFIVAAILSAYPGASAERVRDGFTTAGPRLLIHGLAPHSESQRDYPGLVQVMDGNLTIRIPASALDQLVEQEIARRSFDSHGCEINWTCRADTRVRM